MSSKSLCFDNTEENLVTVHVEGGVGEDVLNRMTFEPGLEEAKWEEPGGQVWCMAPCFQSQYSGDEAGESRIQGQPELYRETYS